MGIGSALNDAAECVFRGQNGNNVICGFFSDDMDFDPSEEENLIDPLGNPDIFVASYGENNDLEWVFNLGRIAMTDGMSIGGMAIDNEGNILIGGHFSLTVDFDPSDNTANLSSAGGPDAFLAKYDEEGNYIWAISIGTSSNESITELDVDQDNQIIAGLRFSSEVDVDPGENEEILIPEGGIDAAILKFSDAGQFQWTQHIQPGGENELITALSCNQEGDIAIGAMVNGLTQGIPEQSMWIGQMDSEGNLTWSYDFNNQGQSNEVSHLSYSQDGAFLYVGGRFRSVTDFDPGEQERIISPLFADPFLAKYTAEDGSLEWVTSVESASTEDYCAGITEANGLVFMAGTFDVSAIFVPGDFNTQVVSNGDRDLFISVYDSQTGEFISASTFGGEGGELVRNAEFTEDGDLLVAGEFLISMGLDPEESIDSQGVSDILFGEFEYLYNLRTSSYGNDREIKIYPIPSPDKVFVEIPGTVYDEVKVKIVNVVGQSVLEFDDFEPNQLISLDISTLNTGIYIVEVKNGDRKISKRLIKQ